MHNDQAADDDGNDNDDADDDDNANDQAADDDKVEDDDLIRYENVSENIDASQLNVFSKLDMQIWLHTSYLSFFVHGQDFSSKNFTPKST